jgi:beta-xylosidase
MVVVTACQSEGVKETPALKATYRNPLLPEREIADPDVIRVGKTYYLYATTDGRGYEAFASTDLVHWERKSRAFSDPRGGAWAPDVFHHRKGDGKFYLYYTDSAEGKGPALQEKQIGVAVADSPLGPFEDKGPLVSNAIDAELFQDDDGSFYLYYADLAGGFKIRVQPMADPLTKRGEPRIVVRPTEEWERRNAAVTEGPVVLKRAGIYYLMYSGNGADWPDYAIGYATARSPVGPFEKYAGNPIARRSQTVLGPGHHCVAEGPDGRLWLVYHQKWDAGHNFHRFLAIDPLWFDRAGVIHVKLSRGTSEPAP